MNLLHLHKLDAVTFSKHTQDKCWFNPGRPVPTPLQSFDWDVNQNKQKWSSFIYIRGDIPGVDYHKIYVVVESNVVKFNNFGAILETETFV